MTSAPRVAGPRSHGTVHAGISAFVVRRCTGSPSILLTQTLTTVLDVQGQRWIASTCRTHASSTARLLWTILDDHVLTTDKKAVRVISAAQATCDPRAHDGSPCCDDSGDRPARYLRYSPRKALERCRSISRSFEQSAASGRAFRYLFGVSARHGPQCERGLGSG